MKRGPTVPPAVRWVRWVPTGPRRARGDGAGPCMGPNINRAPIWDRRGTRRAVAGVYMLRAALVVTHFFWAKTDMSPK